MSEVKKIYNSVSDPKSLNCFVNRSCALLFADADYCPPTPEEVQSLIKLAGWSQTEVARLVGVSWSKKGSTTVRKWQSKVGTPDHRVITYSTWRLMLLYAGVVKLSTK